MKYSILMPYHNRLPQLQETLRSLRTWYGDRNDWEVILAVDGKSAEQIPLERALAWNAEGLPVVRKRCLPQKCSPVRLYNIAARIACGEFFIITNPECLHSTNVLQGLDRIFADRPEVYAVCACVAQKADGSFLQWYQHSLKRNARLHFCSALSRENFFKAGGFDERYAEGYCWDDNDFRDSIEAAGIPTVVRDDLLVSHQHHEKVRPGNWKALWDHNRRVYEEKWGRKAVEA